MMIDDYEERSSKGAYSFSVGMLRPPSWYISYFHHQKIILFFCDLIIDLYFVSFSRVMGSWYIYAQRPSFTDSLFLYNVYFVNE